MQIRFLSDKPLSHKSFSAIFASTLIVLIAGCATSDDTGSAVTQPTVPLLTSPSAKAESMKAPSVTTPAAKAEPVTTPSLKTPKLTSKAPMSPPAAAMTPPMAKAATNSVLTSRVTDKANLLTAQQRSAIRAQLTRYEKETTHQIAVLTVESLAGASIEDYSMRVKQAARLGAGKSDNGILLTIAVAEKKVRAEIGLGFEKYLQATNATQIIEKNVLPHLAEGRYFEGISDGVESLMSAARQYRVQ